MKRIWIFLFALPLLLTQCNNENQNKMELVWAEEFDYSGAPDSTRWSYELGYIRNHEMQKYTNALENVSVEDGVLTITARMEDDSTITSGSINTWHKEDIEYGRMEVRAKIPSALGTWPAIWMLGINRAEMGWPDCGEIDIMEHVGYRPDVIHGTAHTKAYNHKVGTQKGAKISVGEPWSDFHIYAVEWFENQIDFFYDDSLYFSFENDLQENNETWPFDKPHYLLMNVAFGGSWGGREGVDLDALPLKMEVDYVRYYK